jgi:hypothetical protein
MATNSLGNCAKTGILIADQLGTSSEPISSVYETGNIYLKDSINYIDNLTGNKRLEIDADGTIKETGKTVLVSGGNINTGTELFYTGLNTNQDFVIHTNATNNDSITVNKTTGVVTIYPPLPSNPINPLTLNTTNNLTGATVVYDGSLAKTFTVGDNGTNLNTPNTLVQRDSTGNFTAGTITASLAGNSTTASSATNILGGVTGNIPVQSSVNTTSFISNGTSGQVLTAQGAGNIPIWSSAAAVNDGILSINNGTHITGSGTFTANQATNTSITIGTDATNINTASTIVARDGAGNFSCGTITGSLAGNATTSTTAVNIQGGSAGVVPYQSATSTTSFTALGTSGQYLQSQGTSAPIWNTVPTPSDATITLATTGHLSGGSSFTLNQSGNQTITLTSDATNLNTASTIVSRDSAGAFTCGTITTPSVISATDLTLNAGTGNVIQLLKPVNFNGNNITNLLSIAGILNTNLPISATGTGSLSLFTNGNSRLTISSTGGSTFSGSLTLNSTLIDGASSAGTSGQILSSTGTATTWISPSSLTVGTATNALNVSTSAIGTNTVFYIPMVSSYATSTNQIIYTDQNGHLTYNPSTNQLTTNGTVITNGYTMNGSASQFLINNNSSVTPAISAPNAVTISFPNANVISKNLTSTTITDNSSSVGTSGQVLSSTGTGLAWTTSSSSVITTTSDNSAGSYYIPFSKTTAGTATSLYLDDTTTTMTYNPSTTTLALNGSSTTTTITPSVITVANPGGTSTLTSVGLTTKTITTPTTSDLTLNSTSGIINLQTNGTINTQITSTGLQLVDTAATPNKTGISQTWYGTPSVSYTNILPPIAPATGINAVLLNVGAYTSSAGTTTKQPYTIINYYSPTTNHYTSATDPFPLALTGTDTSKQLQLNYTGSVNSTLTISNSTNTSKNAKLLLNSGSGGAGGTTEPTVQLLCGTGTTGFPSPNIGMSCGTGGAAGFGVSITNNNNNLVSAITNSVSVSNTNLLLTSDNDGTGTTYQQMTMTPSQTTLANAFGSLMTILASLTTLFTNLTFGLSPSGNPTGLLEQSVNNASVTGTTTLNIASDAFKTIVNTPTSARTFVLATPSTPYLGYWYAICNRSTTQTIAVQYPSGTTIYTIPVSTNATNGGTTARFAVGVAGTNYFRVF